MTETIHLSALLVMDIQPPMVGSMADPGPFVDKLNMAISHARGKGVPVVFVVVGFRPGYPEVSPLNQSFSRFRSEASYPLDDPENTTVYEGVNRKEEDIVIIKRRVSAFAGSDLEVVLRATGIRELTLSGISTSGVVLSTLREAADKDYRLTVLEDCCFDRDPETHRVLTEKVFPRQASVLPVARWIAGEA